MGEFQSHYYDFFSNSNLSTELSFLQISMSIHRSYFIFKINRFQKYKRLKYTIFTFNFFYNFQFDCAQKDSSNGEQVYGSISISLVSSYTFCMTGTLYKLSTKNVIFKLSTFHIGGEVIYNSSKHLVFVNIMRNRRHTCLAAFSNAPGDFPLNRSIFGKK